jgi:hypothetical protein
MKYNMKNNKKSFSDYDETKIREPRKSKKAKRHKTKGKLKDIAKGALDYYDYMEMEDWSDSK